MNLCTTYCAEISSHAYMLSRNAEGDYPFSHPLIFELYIAHSIKQLLLCFACQFFSSLIFCFWFHKQKSINK
jgi:hypothetical protein